MQISKKQTEQLAEEQEQEFRSRLRKILKEDYPEDVEDIGEEDFDTVIDLGLAHARSYGIVREMDIGLYFDVMFLLAYDFDTDPDFPWAAQILNDADLSGPEKVRRVAAMAQAILEEEDAQEEDEEVQ